ncbi:MAG: glycogen synthase GlgA [Pigmentiphaga sp.]|uniref:glycogen synthase GlgA n=1 Tax=Pigmentiphaga sp. TaxID=1977564 RepID=UPI0029B44048|nr:glycogen synthase GlgA [Pigmentiphaga sp.]MDX3907903.1 glycogen synthase GlgA [Pigmentiphaga sp.]
MLVTSEALPLAKTGGLGDAVSGLTRALRDAHVDATIFMPAYESAMDAACDLVQVAELPGLIGGDATVWAGWVADSEIPVLLLRNDDLYMRPGNPYLDERGKEFPDNGIRFAALAQATKRISVADTPIRVPHVVHAHDWHAALAPLYLHAAGAKRPKTVLTIHNLAFQGLFPMRLADDLGIPHAYRGSDGAEFWGNLSFMKAGLRYADRLTTVSASYAREILTPQFGHGLDGVLRERAHELHAIPNGIDTEVWDPGSDPFLPEHFTVLDMRGKVRNKLEMQRAFGLPTDPEAPLLAMGSRLTSQKMADLAVEVFPSLLAAHPRLQIAVLGCGEPAIEESMRALARRHPRHVGVHIGYDEARGHLLHAGADMLLHGSRFEPFGLTPIYSMRYGTVPIASRVGGLADSIVGLPADPEAEVGTATGILFDGDTTADMLAAVERALETFAQPQRWSAMQKNGMTTHFGWEASAAQYVELYRMLAPVAPVGAPMVAPRPEAASAPVAATMRKRA